MDRRSKLVLAAWIISDVIWVIVFIAALKRAKRAAALMWQTTDVSQKEVISSGRS
jgi:hypothetical protein